MTFNYSKLNKIKAKRKNETHEILNKIAFVCGYTSVCVVTTFYMILSFAWCGSPFSVVCSSLIVWCVSSPLCGVVGSSL